MTVKTTRGLGRTVAAIVLTGVMGLGLAACNDGDAQVDKMPESSMSSSTSSSTMSEENKMDGKMSGGGMTHAELAETTGVPLGTAKTRVRDGLRKLERILNEQRDALREGGA